MSRRRGRPGGLALRRPGGGCPLTSAREGKPEERRGAKAARGLCVAAGAGLLRFPLPIFLLTEKTELYLRPRRTMRRQAVLSWLQMTQMTLTKNKHRRNKGIRLCGPIPCHAGMHAKIPRSLPSRG
ncbi:mitochondrial intermembrane space import and assembly protein 40 isoform X2 [Grus americana]|uniref:mitochondrial intermembrane space import and assembly protein 40 isoform X2 n=1 Tax=Grus americana TaxID=9117 RepID=UPI002408253B|nr:mitochondrial intermembrane space import and assembly protein 40 isoform X2 [Grus americana]